MNNIEEKIKLVEGKLNAFLSKNESDMHLINDDNIDWDYFLKDKGKYKIADLVFSVNDVYITFSTVSPASKFGGIWERLSNVFLYATPVNGNIGLTGGETNHILTVAEMPPHAHGILINIQHSDGTTVPYSEALTSGLQAGGRRRYVDVSGAQGSGSAHNNMPPHMQCAMWKRIA